MALEIRRAVAGDEDAVAAVHVRGWQVGYRGLLPEEGLATLDPAEWARRRDFTPTDRCTFLGVIGERIVGFATVGPMRGVDGDGGEVYAIYVDPEGWGEGTGRALIAAARGWLVEQGYTDAGLWVLAGNDRAQRFYRADGWAPDGVTKTATILGREVEEVRFVRRLGVE